MRLPMELLTAELMAAELPPKHSAIRRRECESKDHWLGWFQSKRQQHWQWRECCWWWATDFRPQRSCHRHHRWRIEHCLKEPDFRHCRPELVATAVAAAAAAGEFGSAAPKCTVAAERPFPPARAAAAAEAAARVPKHHFRCRLAPADHRHRQHWWSPTEVAQWRELHCCLKCWACLKLLAVVVPTLASQDWSRRQRWRRECWPEEAGQGKKKKCQAGRCIEQLCRR